MRDINDNPPVFPNSGYSFMVSQDAEADMAVITVTATDEDSGENGRVSYEILQGNLGWAGLYIVGNLRFKSRKEQKIDHFSLTIFLAKKTISCRLLIKETYCCVRRQGKIHIHR